MKKLATLEVLVDKELNWIEHFDGVMPISFFDSYSIDECLTSESLQTKISSVYKNWLASTKMDSPEVLKDIDTFVLTLTLNHFASKTILETAEYYIVLNSWGVTASEGKSINLGLEIIKKQRKSND